MPKQPRVPASPDTSSFAMTHCVTCAAGWTRRSQDGLLVVCLLDRERVWPEMTDCDRFEPRQEDEPAEA